MLMMTKPNKILLIILNISLIISFYGCKSMPASVKDHTAYNNAKRGIATDIANNKIIDKNIEEELPESVNNALINFRRFGMQDEIEVKPDLRKFDMVVKAAPAHDFFMGLVKDTGKSMVVSPDVEGDITLSLKNVTVKEVLDTVERVYGFQYYISDNGYEILPNKLDTRIFSVNYLDMERTGSSSVQVTTSGITSGGSYGGGGGYYGNRYNNSAYNNNYNNYNNYNGYNGSGYNGYNGYNNGYGSVSSGGATSQVSTSTLVNFWGKLEDTLFSIVGEEEGRKVVVNPQSGVIVVTAYPKELRVIAEYLDQVQAHMTRQVIIEAKVVEVELSDEYQMGIDWRMFGQQLNSIQGIVGSSSEAYSFKKGLLSHDFNMNLKALATQGTVQVLSSPRVSTVNNQKAVIKAGSDEFFVTNVATNIIANNSSTTTATPNVNLTPFFSGITLDVTPYVDKDENITLHVHPAVSTVSSETKTIDAGGATGTLSLPLAKSKIRETDAVVRARNGQVIVLGGLMQDETNETVNKMPYIGDLPFLGTLFRRTSQNTTKSELVILLKVTVMQPNLWTDQLEASAKRLNRLDQGFHVGNRPDLYGTRAEKPVKNWPIDPKVEQSIERSIENSIDYIEDIFDTGSADNCIDKANC